MSKYYAVARGWTQGIYRSWDECKKNVVGYSGAAYKSFKTKPEAEKYISSHVDVKTNSVVEVSHVLKKRKRNHEETLFHEDTCVHVYTDGACEGNGTSGAVSGIGVYFPFKEYKNVSKKINGKQTNNTAELSAIKEAIAACKDTDDILVHIDSEYCIKVLSNMNKAKQNVDLINDIKSMIERKSGMVRFKKVKGHTGEEDGNYWADKLATKAIK